jgi:TrmH family RNA methyltransferase
MITSASNKKIKNVMLLISKAKERGRQQLFVAEGIKMFLEAPISWLREVYLSENLDFEREMPEEVRKKLKELENQTDCSVETVREDIFCRMCDTRTPQGILCVLAMPDYNQDRLLSERDGLYLVLEDIQDPGNLGTMIRAGEGAGMTAIILSKHTVDIWNPKTIRATMGSIYRVPFFYAEDLKQVIADMKQHQIRIYAAHLQGEKSYDKEDYHKASAFLIGNEGNGLSHEIAGLADSYLKIPMLGKVESLNAAIAATLFLYEAARQRRN